MLIQTSIISDLFCSVTEARIDYIIAILLGIYSCGPRTCFGMIIEELHDERIGNHQLVKG